MATTLATWTIDPVHSSVEFSLDYMGFSTYRTGFRALEGSLEFDAARPAASSVAASIPVASVDVTNDRLMSRLMDPTCSAAETIRRSRSRAPESRLSTRRTGR
jgi:polyisoprenoid-binding protein YceI